MQIPGSQHRPTKSESSGKGLALHVLPGAPGDHCDPAHSGDTRPAEDDSGRETGNKERDGSIFQTAPEHVHMAYHSSLCLKNQI